MADEERRGARTDEAADRETIARLTADVVPTLIERLAGSELGELEVREQGWRVRLRRTAYVNGRAPSPSVAPAQAANRPATAHSDGRQPHREPRRDEVPSPAVGYFTPRDGVTPGSELQRGDVLGHVDVLGVRVEVVAPSDGRLAALEVQAGEAVEYGQPIARLEPVSVGGSAGGSGSTAADV